RNVTGVQTCALPIFSATFAHLVQLRATHPVLRPVHYRFLTSSGRPTRAWFDAHGEEMSHEVWHDPHYRVLQLTRETGNSDDRRMLVVITAAANSAAAPAPTHAATAYDLVSDSTCQRPQISTLPPELGRLESGGDILMPGMSMRIYLSANH